MRKQGLSKKLMRLVATTLVGLFAVGLVGGTALAKTTLVVYTAKEYDELEPLKKAFEAEHPDIEIRWVRESTGIITARLLAEKDNPQADVVFGTAGTSLLLLDELGLLMPYAPKGLNKVDSKFRDPRDPPRWVGVDAYVAVVCYNTVEAKKKGLPRPTSWKDLTKSVYRGHLVMPNPNSSGTGFLTVSSWFQVFGEEVTWKFMDALHENMAQYTHSGSKPCRMAGAGEFPIGISFAFRGAKLKAKGAPLALIYPKEGIGWEIEANAIVTTTKKAEAAKKLADWAVSPGAMKVYNDFFPVLAIPKLAKPVQHYPGNTLEMMIKNDFAWAAKNRKRILGEWQKRYGVKTEPKKK